VTRIATTDLVALVGEGKSVSQIAEALGCSRPTVYARCRELGLEPRNGHTISRRQRTVVYFSRPEVLEWAEQQGISKICERAYERRNDDGQV
jgi:transposase